MTSKFALIIMTSFFMLLLLSPTALAVTQSQTLSYISVSSNTDSCSGCSLQYQIDIAEKGTLTYSCSGTTAAMCSGDDGTTTAVLLYLTPGSGHTSGFTAAGIVSGDNYEVDMVIGSLAFDFVLHGTGSAAATMYSYFCTTSCPGAPATWSAGPTASCTSCASGSAYPSTGFATSSVGFEIVDTGGGSSKSAEIVFYVTDAYLASLTGASGASVTQVHSRTFSSGTICPQSTAPSGGFCLYSSGTLSGTSQDSYPSSGSGSFTLAGPLPELPLGLFFLAAPAVLAYALIRKKRVSLP
jgi:hypothetical protein